MQGIVVVGYSVVPWAVVQAASIIVPELQLPAWLTRAVIVVALLGFPLALVLAWACDLTPWGKELKLSEGAGHKSLPEQRIPAIREFLDRHLSTGTQR